MKKSQKKRSRKRTRKTPETEDIREEHPMLADDSGAWSDHDNDWVLQGRMP